MTALSNLMSFDEAIIMEKYVQGLMDQIQTVVDKVTVAAKSVAESSSDMSHTAEQAGTASTSLA